MATAAQGSGTFIPMSFPLKGIDLENPFDLQPPATTPAAENVRAVEPLTLRARGGSRPGLGRYLGPVATRSVIQSLDFIVDPQAEFTLSDTDSETPTIPGLIFINDPSTNNFRTRNPGPRRVRKGGSGRQSNINVGRTAVDIIWADPADIVVGTALGGTQLNATATTGIFMVDGTFTYTPTAGAVLALGNGQALNVRFAPTNPTFYKTATKTVHINVVENKIVTHVDPAVVGTIRSVTVDLLYSGISAVGRDPSNGLVPGVMTYNPVRTTLPSVPSVTVIYTFTPTDTVNYFDSTLTVTYPVVVSTVTTAVGHGTSQSAPTADSDPVTASDVSLSLDGGSEDDYGGVTCVSRNPDELVGAPWPGIGSPIGIEWVPNFVGATFPDQGVFYWNFSAS